MFACTECDKVFSHKWVMVRHVKTVHGGDIREKCNICNSVFNRKDNLKNHLKLQHSISVSKEGEKKMNKRKLSEEPSTSSAPSNKKTKNTTVKHCSVCNESIVERNWSRHLRKNSHKESSRQFLKDNVSLIEGAFKNRVKSYSIQNNDESILDSKVLFDINSIVLTELLQAELEELTSIKFQLELFGEFVKNLNDEDNMCAEVKSMQTKMVVLLKSDNISEKLKEMVDDIQSKLEEFQERDSGWALLSFLRIEVNVNKYQPLRGSQYFKLPLKLQEKHACINVQNLDIYCFKWAVISALDEQVTDDHQRPSAYNIKNIAADFITVNNRVVNFSNMDFPLMVKDVNIFERNNQDISVNVFGYEFNNSVSDYNIVGPYYHTQMEKRKHINLLYCENLDDEHYVYIKNISRLISSDQTKKKTQMHLCNGCLQRFGSESILELHKSECCKIVTIMPEEGENYVTFKNFNKKMIHPFAVYADFESILQPTSNCMPDPQKSSTTDVQQHVPCAFSYFIKCSFDSKYDMRRTYIGENAADKFVEMLVDDLIYLYKQVLMVKKPMIALTDMEIYTQEHTAVCHICENGFKEGDTRVRDHCHLTGLYRGPAHNTCNLDYKISKMFPVMFHNFSGYDCHLFVKSLAKVPGRINIIPLNKENYISLTKHIFIDQINSFNIRFLDSNRFLQSSLDSLAKNLSDDDLISTKKYFPNDESFKLMLRKGVFPYDHLDSWERFNECSFPPITKFYNKLIDRECSEEEYNHAVKVWNHFKCESLKDYLRLYLQSDVLLLTDIFENFRKVCMSIYSLDPCHYYTAPGLSWDAMLKTTKVNLELLTDVSMYNFFKSGIRGGLCQCSHRHAIANNKYLSKYSQKKLTEYLMYYDANNLYGWAMSQPLPYGSFQWDDSKIYTSDYISNLKDENIGYVLEVDLTYPSHLHDIHNDLPFCPENIKTPGCKFSKLIANLDEKNRYIIHLNNLQQCMQNGLVLKKVHKVLKFRQSRWLQTYISLNTEYRRRAKNDFQKNFFKLMNNSIYGKTMENVEKRRDVRIVINWENSTKRQGARSIIAHPNFHSRAIFSANMAAFELKNGKITLDKPIYLGFAVLELSKWLMYDFHYDYMRNKFNDSIRLNYTDTDSFIYSIKTEDFYADIYDDVINSSKPRFDTSDYPEDNTHNFPQRNGKALGLFKDENNSRKMVEFIGLRAKMYSFSIDNAEVIKKAKGVKKSVTSSLDIRDYRKCLIKKQNVVRSMYIFRSKLHTIYTQQINKLALSYNDTKRYICSDGISTYAWGHYKILE